MMCGIAAISLTPKERSLEDWEMIRATFTRNLLSNEERGQAATGLAVVDVYGQVIISKMPLPATQFVKTKEYQILIDQIGPNTTLILGHTRMPTKGDPAYNNNNHPLQAGPVLGVHNGHIDNDDELFSRFRFPRQAQVDSEIIFHLLASVSPINHIDCYLKTIQPRLSLLQGQFTFLACDQRLPERLLVFKHNNPLCIHFHEEWSALVFSSRYIFLRKSFGHALILEALGNECLLVFDARAIPFLGNQPFAWLPLKVDHGNNVVNLSLPG